MSENIIIALLTLIGSVGSSALLINWRLKELEKKVESHNNYSKLFAEYSKSMAVMAKDIEYIRKEICEVKQDVK